MTSEISKDEVHSGNQERRNSSQEKPLEEKTDRPTVCTETISRTSEHEDSVCDQSPAGLGDHSVQKQRNSSQEMSNEKMDRSVENIESIGPTAQHQDLAGDQSLPGSKRFLWGICLVVVAAILVQTLIKPELPRPKEALRQIDIFLGHLEKLKGQFPNQRAELWTRSRIHLLRHLQTAQPTEPVSLILTAGVRGERTMRCLAYGLASTFSAAHNASVLHIDGASTASQDSDQVKLDIDSKLQVAFEGDKPVAVIHRFEELPPGSTLIFYRYCDHENAAYKRTFLIFTVLLEDEEEIPPKSTLSAVEEMVDDHLQKKFLSGGHQISFDRMDRDKYGGLWSRISHLILPVAADKRMERDECPWT
ncbi:torsin-1A-interacting protein 2-like isoform X2 [Nelusetta ayraudi]|uniref:torsin-1A-interacting protein 2-like isoform X2 n=1 Tax=Nelusetta ayraudi TaxID=303726 RepID=UPI003F71C9CD